MVEFFCNHGYEIRYLDLKIFESAKSVIHILVATHAFLRYLICKSTLALGHAYILGNVPIIIMKVTIVTSIIIMGTLPNMYNL